METSLNYYPFHIGDYASATRHLSWDENAAYRLLLDVYYTTEKPLPVEPRKVCRLILATTESQREAVAIVLTEFFEQTDAGWVNHRADLEIAAMREKQQKQRDKANKRWHPAKPEHGNASAMQEHALNGAVASALDAVAMPPTPTPTPTPKKKTLPAGAGEGRFPDFWNTWPSTERKADRKRCLAKWKLAHFDDQAEEILSHVKASKTTRKWLDGYEPAPLTYLNGERWRDGVTVGQQSDIYAGAI